ncbi:ubiquitin carboxyl-terminal hydrolase 8-like [Drosophila serrata]|uniref:ubiquitin carboxyl-terminal hydrolase 8-like n=1 Tax=Drosophila serrata TaxID=7274 RepID=UPI000A1D0875|nr:ubiquitin carboxyl-terminal hydrolase 8-like [Drosophila serrata]
MAQLKKLYLSSDIEGLEKMSIIPDCRNKSMKILLNTARKLYMNAEEKRLDGDEEQAYIAYMKYFNMLHAIHNKPDYANHKTTVRQMLGDTASNRRIMDSLELITQSLSLRYEQLHSSAAEPIAASIVANGQEPERSTGELRSISPPTTT